LKTPGQRQSLLLTNMTEIQMNTFSHEEIQFEDVPVDAAFEEQIRNIPTNAIEAEPSPPNAMSKVISKCGGISHPISLFFHVIFKFLALFSYAVLPWIVDSFVLVFILVILFMAADFWTVKNVTGRLLVGLRWWNEVREDGSNEWIFESLEGKRKISTAEAIVFWVCLLFLPLCWLLFALLAIFEFSPLWLVVVLVGFILSVPNIYGYLRCAKGMFIGFELNFYNNTNNDVQTRCQIQT
jgi:hypothetical protein